MTERFGLRAVRIFGVAAVSLLLIVGGAYAADQLASSGARDELAAPTATIEPAHVQDAETTGPSASPEASDDDDGDDASESPDASDENDDDSSASPGATFDDDGGDEDDDDSSASPGATLDDDDDHGDDSSPEPSDDHGGQG